jgi:hypothetical protein
MRTGSSALSLSCSRRFRPEPGTTPMHQRSDSDGNFQFTVGGAFYFVASATTRQSKNLAQPAHCVIAVASSGIDLVVEGEATKVRDEARLQQIASAYAVQNGLFSADDAAPGTGPPPYDVYEVVPVTVFGLGTEEPYGATCWHF